jgi:hypothetical protein
MTLAPQSLPAYPGPAEASLNAKASARRTVVWVDDLPRVHSPAARPPPITQSERGGASYDD